MSDEATLTSAGGPGRSVAANGEAYVLQVFLPEHVLRFPLPSSGDLRVGRSADAEIRLPDPSVSRRHAIFRWTNNGLWLEDERSRNGTYVNMHEVERIKVRLGDQITFGNIVGTVHAASELGRFRSVACEEIHRLIDSEIERSRRVNEQFSLVMFKATGCQRHLSTWIECVDRELGAADVLAAFGTESALILMPHTSDAAVARMAARVSASPAVRVARVVHATISYPGSKGRADELIEEISRRIEKETCPPNRALPSAGAVIVRSESMRRVYHLAERIAKSDATALIQGETGVGKELIAEFIHENSHRSGGPLIRVNCGAIAPTLIESTLFGHERGAFTGADSLRKGLFEAADGGTLFLDEIGELSAAAQAALLRVIETGSLTRVGGTVEVRVDVRVLAATHRDLHAATESGHFRADLLYRMTTLIIEVPPLRERVEEIVPLARSFLEHSNRAHDRSVQDLTAEVVELLERHTWPGNVRELRNAMERAVVMARTDVIEVGELPPTISLPESSRTGMANLVHPDGATALSFKDRIRTIESRLMIDALLSCDGNKTAAARRLNMPLRTFMSKWAAYDLDNQSLHGDEPE